MMMHGGEGDFLSGLFGVYLTMMTFVTFGRWCWLAGVW